LRKGLHYGVPEEVRSVTSEKDRLAAEVEDRWVDFQMALSDKRRYPLERFRAFWQAGKRYAELTKADALIHRSSEGDHFS
jgi:hypothetical protein